jgi:hypothetical protein
MMQGVFPGKNSHAPPHIQYESIPRGTQYSAGFTGHIQVKGLEYSAE